MYNGISANNTLARVKGAIANAFATPAFAAVAA
jgi:hypothetical protein